MSSEIFDKETIKFWLFLIDYICTYRFLASNDYLLILIQVSKNSFLGGRCIDMNILDDSSCVKIFVIAGVVCCATEN